MMVRIKRPHEIIVSFSQDEARALRTVLQNEAFDQHDASEICNTVRAQLIMAVTDALACYGQTE